MQRSGIDTIKKMFKVISKDQIKTSELFFKQSFKSEHSEGPLDKRNNIFLLSINCLLLINK